MNRPCLTALCPNYAERRGRCRKCNAMNDKSIRRAGRALYRTKAWKLTRRQVLFEEPLCRHCKAEGRDGLAEEVHHIDGNPFNNERGNLEPICKRHHSQLTRRSQVESR